jgi:hypothetical protein
LTASLRGAGICCRRSDRAALLCAQGIVFAIMFVGCSSAFGYGIGSTTIKRLRELAKRFCFSGARLASTPFARSADKRFFAIFCSAVGNSSHTPNLNGGDQGSIAKDGLCVRSGLPGSGLHAPIVFLNFVAYAAGSRSLHTVKTTVSCSAFCGGRILHSAFLAPCERCLHSIDFSISTRLSRSSSASFCSPAASLRALAASSCAPAASWFELAAWEVRPAMVPLNLSFVPMRAPSEIASPIIRITLDFFSRLFFSCSPPQILHPPRR